MTVNPPRLLVVEDDNTLRDALMSGLRSAGYEVHGEADGVSIRAVAASFRPDLAVLDVRLPHGPSGLSVAKLLREGSPDLPIIFVTAASSEDDRLAGFEVGADDYVVKPFSIAELNARIRALLRRSGRLTSETWQVADLVVDSGSRTVHRAGEKVELTRTEFDLLAELGRNFGRVTSKTQLLMSVWGFDANDANLVEVHLSALRKKLEAHGPRLIHTIRGTGYVMKPPD